jgi:hypothetical protein
MTYEEFSKEVKGVSNNRNHKITNSNGVYQSYKWLRKNKWLDIGRPLKEHEFYSIVRKINDYLADEIISGRDVTLPCRMGRIEVRKHEAYVKYEDNKLKTNLPIDWDKTLKLWYEDKESYKNKTLIKMEEKEMFKIFYNRISANYNNKSYYDFSPNRYVKLSLKQRIKEGNFDAYLINRAYVE